MSGGPTNARVMDVISDLKHTAKDVHAQKNVPEKIIKAAVTMDSGR